MKWVLAVIVFNSYQPDIENIGVFTNLEECFWAREWLLEYDLETDSQGYPINSQAICVRVDDYILDIDETPPLQ